jgi:glycosyltransferase involved in cell wall biosynthesis
VTNRGVGQGYAPIDAKARVLWTHDLPHDGFIRDRQVLKAFAQTVFMSQYAEDVWRTYYPYIGASTTIPNGVDKSLFYPREKDLGYLIYFSHPNRGLKRLPLIAQAVAELANRRVKVVAFSKAEGMYAEGDTGAKDHSDAWEIPDATENVLTIRDPIPQAKIAEEVGRAGLCILPSGYPEICSNNVLQSLASGTPLVTTGHLGSTPEWVQHRKNGMLTKFGPEDYMVHTVEIIRNALEVLNDERLHRKLIAKAAKTRILSWEEVGEKWERLLLRCS